MLRTTRILSLAALAVAFSLCTSAHAAAATLSPALAHNGGNGCGGGGNHGCNNHNHHHGNHNGGCGGGNNSLECDIGGPYTVECGPAPLSVVVDASGSDGATTFHWSTNYPGGMFADPDAAATTFTFDPSGCCDQEIRIYLTVGSGNNSRTCDTKVRVRDTQPPTIECPELAKIACGESESPNALGRPVVSDNCDSHPTVTYKDKIVVQDCRAERLDHTIERTWKVRDDCGNRAECVQFIHVVKQVVSLDALPGQCPNVVSFNSCAPVRIAILGTPTFNVGSIQAGSVRLYAEHCEGGQVSPLSVCASDVSTPFFGNFSTDCECHDLNGDGRLDLVVSFRRNQVISALGLCDLPSGSTKRIVVTGRLAGCDSCAFLGTDCLQVP